MPNTKNWTLKKIKKTTAFRWSLLLAICVTALLFHFFREAESLDIFNFILLIFLVHIASAVAILGVYVLDQRRNRVITIDGTTLLVPRLFGPTRKISTIKIKSIENITNGNNITAIQLGRSYSTTIIIENRLFITENEFLDFLKNLQSTIKNNKYSTVLIEPAPKKSSLITSDQTIIATISLVYLVIYMFFSDPTYSALGPKALTSGGLTKDLKIEEIYKLASSLFLHANPYHLGLNVISLAVIGKNVLHIFGRIRSVNMFFWSAMTGSLLSLIYSNFDIVIGCSGGIMGLLGSCWIANLIFSRKIPGSVTTSSQQIFLILVLQFSADFFIGTSDTASHFGGFLFGCCYAKLASTSLRSLRQPTLIENIIYLATVLFVISSLLNFFTLK